MDWKRAIREECEALMPIVALLLSLADLAGIAGDRSAPVRGLVLWLLRRAERVAREFVTCDPPPQHWLQPADGSRLEAAQLARSFAELAADLARQLEDCRAWLDFATPDESCAGHNIAQSPVRPHGGIEGFLKTISGLLSHGLPHPDSVPDTS